MPKKTTLDRVRAGLAQRRLDALAEIEEIDAAQARIDLQASLMGWPATVPPPPRPEPVPRSAWPRCGARCRSKGGYPCQAPVTWDAENNRPATRSPRCRMHGGCSTGPTTPEGRQRAREAARRGAAARWAANSPTADVEPPSR